MTPAQRLILMDMKAQYGNFAIKEFRNSKTVFKIFTKDNILISDANAVVFRTLIKDDYVKSDTQDFKVRYILSDKGIKHKFHKETSKILKEKMKKMEPSTYSLAKALHHINIAKEYLLDVKRDSNGAVKNLFNNYILKCEYIIGSMRDIIGDESREILKKELSQSFDIEAINDKIMHLNLQQRNEIELIIDKMIGNERKNN